MNYILKLLREVDWWIKNKNVQIKNNDDEFNMFSICGVNHYENTHSSIIAELLSPKSSHQFNHLFLEALIQTLILNQKLSADYKFNFQGVEVKREYGTKFGRLDILVKNSLNEALLIENKIYACDQFEQLKRYSIYGKNTFGVNFKLLYLTLWGNESSDANKAEIDYIQISYSEIIQQWLSRCIEIAARSPIVRETLIQYSNHLKHLTNTNTSANMNKELINELSTIENIESVITIADNASNVKNNIINTTFLKHLQEVADELDLKLLTTEGDFVNTSWSGFGLSNPLWKNYDIFMEFGAKGLRNLIIGLYPKNDQVDTSAFLTIKEKVGGGNNRCAFVRFPQHPNWETDAMKAILTGEMKLIVKNKIIELIDVTEGIENL